MTEFTVSTIAEAHETVVRYLLEEGQELTTENGELTWESETPVTMIITHPMGSPMVSEACMFGEKSMEQYARQLLELTPPKENGFVYTYANRLMDYPRRIAVIDPRVNNDGLCWTGDGNRFGTNQIQKSIIERLLLSPNSRRAIAVTYVVEKDMASSEPPCLQYVQCFIRDGRLNMVAPFRSHDMLSGAGPNWYALAYLQQYIKDGICAAGVQDLEQGWLCTHSESAHIYWKRDAYELRQFKAKLGVS